MKRRAEIETRCSQIRARRDQQCNGLAAVAASHIGKEPIFFGITCTNNFGMLREYFPRFVETVVDDGDRKPIRVI